MARILVDIDKFISEKKARAIDPIPAPGPSQRGPTCGMYAVSFVMRYWQALSKNETFPHRAKTAPFPQARSNLAVPQQKLGNEAKAHKKLEAEKGNFSSLRQYAKFHKLSLIGSIFDASHLLQMAQGAQSQFAGALDGAVMRSTVENFGQIVKEFLDMGVPLIVPYDTGDAAAPVETGGDGAHWVTLIGYYEDNKQTYAVYYSYGGFYSALVSDFGKSNAQLTSNEQRKMTKITVTAHNGAILRSDFSSDATIKSWEPRGKVTYGKVEQNPEFNNPKDRSNVGGLCNRVVAVYRIEDAKELDEMVKRYS